MVKVLIETPVVLLGTPEIEFTISGLPIDLAECQLDVGLGRVDLLRDSFAGFRGGAAMAASGRIQMKLQLCTPVEVGLHLINLLRIRTYDGSREIVAQGQFEGLPAYFRVSSCLTSGQVTLEEIRATNAARVAAIAKEWVTSAAISGGEIYSAYVFCAATLVHAEHHLEGFSIYPLQDALTEESLRIAMNAFAGPRLGLEILPNADLSAGFRRSSPAFVLGLHRIRAMSHDDATAFALVHADRVNVVLGIERGQKPSVFGVIVHKGFDTRLSYIYPGYRGNLLHPMLNEHIAMQLESLLPKIQSSAWARLLTSNYAEATAESDHDFQYLRFWSLLELIAKKHVTSDRQKIFRPDGSQILRTDGQAVVTSGAKAKVYSYLMAAGVLTSVISFGGGSQIHLEGDKPAPPGPYEIVPLWEQLGAMYFIRNSVAHAGEYAPDVAAPAFSDEGLAARFFSSGTLYRNLRDLAHAAMYREL